MSCPTGKVPSLPSFRLQNSDCHTTQVVEHEKCSDQARRMVLFRLCCYYTVEYLLVLESFMRINLDHCLSHIYPHIPQRCSEFSFWENDLLTVCAALVTWHCIGAGAFKCTGAGEEHFVIPMQDTGESYSMKIGPRMLYLPVVKSGPVPERNLEPEARQERDRVYSPQTHSYIIPEASLGAEVFRIFHSID